MRLIKLVLFFLVCALPLSPAMAEKININTADVEILDVGLDGIGPKKAQAIIDYREQHGPFKSIGDITKVSGIGAKTLEKNRDKITVGEPPQPKVAPAVPSKPAIEKIPSATATPSAH